MRFYLYILAGLTSALIGWNLGQFFLTDLKILPQFPEITLFPCVAISLAFGMVINEIFISNPTRYKLNLRIAKTPLLISLGLGSLAGLIAGGISQIIFLLPNALPSPIIRTLGWLLIGISVGVAEGLSWRSHSIEAGDPQKFRQRFMTSCIGAITASLLAAIFFEIVRNTLKSVITGFRNIEDPLGISILGMILGLVFSIANSPAYMGALRAGAGFEYTGFKYDDQPELNQPPKTSPHIDKSLLRFVSEGDTEEIEEGLSIQLPNDGTIEIGSELGKSHIYLPGIPRHLANVIIQNSQILLLPNPKFLSCIEINGYRLTSGKKIRLKHNYVLTFHTTKMDGQKNEEKIYRFVYYNRFLDPQG